MHERKSNFVDKMIDNKIISQYTEKCYPDGELNDTDLIQFCDYLKQEVIAYVKENNIYLPPFFADNLSTDFISYRETWIWKRNLRAYIPELGREAEIYFDSDSDICCLDHELNAYVPQIRIISEEERNNFISDSSPNPVLNDALLCISLGASMLKDDLVIWKQKEEEYLAHPEKFEDVSQYDNNGKAYIIDDYNFKIYMPEESYDCLDKPWPDNWTLTTLQSSLPYNELQYWTLTEDKSIYVLLGVKRFVKEL